MFLAKRGQTDLKNETNMISIALDDFTLVSCRHKVSFYSGNFGPNKNDFKICLSLDADLVLRTTGR